MARPIAKLACEGHVDLAVLKRLATDAGFGIGDAFGLRGKAHISRRLPGYNKAAIHEPWIVARDLDHDFSCAVELSRSLLPNPSRFMCLRIAVRAVESWLIADQKSLSAFFSVNGQRIPISPETLPNPKAALLELMHRSTQRNVREAMVARSRAGRLEEGPEYNAMLGAFAATEWAPDRAAERADSLSRAIRRIRELKRRTE